MIDLGTAVRDLRKSVEEANALRVQRYQKLLFPANPSASGVLKVCWWRKMKTIILTSHAMCFEHFMMCVILCFKMLLKYGVN